MWLYLVMCFGWPCREDRKHSCFFLLTGNVIWTNKLWTETSLKRNRRTGGWGVWKATIKFSHKILADGFALKLLQAVIPTWKASGKTASLSVICKDAECGMSKSWPFASGKCSSVQPSPLVQLNRLFLIGTARPMYPSGSVFCLFIYLFIGFRSNKKT